MEILITPPPMFKKQSKKDLKKKSKKELIALCMSHLDFNAKLSLEIDIIRNEHMINLQALESAESALGYKEKEIEHKDRLLKALTNS